MESICFIETNEEGKISKIHVTSNPRIEFVLDEKPAYPSYMDDLELPEDVYDPILARAIFHGFVDQDVSKEEIKGKNKRLKEYNQCIDSMLMRRGHVHERKRRSRRPHHVYPDVVEKQVLHILEMTKSTIVSIWLP